MKKRYYTFALASLFSIITLAGCAPSDELSTCDPLFGDCDSENSSSAIKIDLEKEQGTNYNFEGVSNAEGSVSYEIFVRSFFDTDNDKVGDFNGIIAKLPYLKKLGVSNLWLMPIHPTTSYHGYDVIDYYDVNPEYGTMEDFDNLVKKAKEQNIDIMIDLVLNHSSDKCTWFEESYQDRKANKVGMDSKADWYAWSDKPQSGYRDYKDIYCEARFDTSMPEFNTNSESFRHEVGKILDFWTNKGVTGFRLDAAKHFSDGIPSESNDFMTFMKEHAGTDVSFVGEVLDPQFQSISTYYGSKCDSFFSVNASLQSAGNESIVGLVKRFNKAATFGAVIERQEKEIKGKNPDAYSSYFLSNHDMDRSSNNLSGNDAKTAASLYLLLPGTPYIYYGEEIGLLGKREVPDLSDARRRLPMVWSKDDKTGECGFPEMSRPDLMENEQVELGGHDLEETGYSLYNHYRKVIEVRNKYPFIKNSIFTNLTSKLNTEKTDILAYSLTKGEEEIIIVLNFGLGNRQVDLPKEGLHIVDSISAPHRIPRTTEDGKLQIGGSSLVVLTK